MYTAYLFLLVLIRNLRFIITIISTKYLILLYKYKFGTTLDMANHIWTEYVLVTMKLKLYPSVKSTLLARSYSILNPILIKECNEKITLGKFRVYFCVNIPFSSDVDPHWSYADPHNLMTADPGLTLPNWFRTIL